MQKHAWHGTVPSYSVVNEAKQRKDVPNTHCATSHAHQRGKRLSKCNKLQTADTDDNYLSQLKLLTQQQQKEKMKTPTSTKNLRNPVFKTPQKHVKHLTASLLEESNIRLLIGEQRRIHTAKLHKRDAIVEVQTQFFSALRKLYTWPLDSLVLANIIEVREFWELQLDNARNLAYRAETIDPNHYGQLRYDIMAEIVKLETSRIEEFLAAFAHYHDLMLTGDISDEFQCDDQMLTFFDPVQTNVILAIPPQWIEETRRPPLTWYAFLSPHRTNDMVTEERLLAPEYYDSTGSN